MLFAKVTTSLHETWKKLHDRSEKSKKLEETTRISLPFQTFSIIFNELWDSSEFTSISSRNLWKISFHCTPHSHVTFHLYSSRTTLVKTSHSGKKFAQLLCKRWKRKVPTKKSPPSVDTSEMKKLSNKLHELFTGKVSIVGRTFRNRHTTQRDSVFHYNV